MTTPAQTVDEKLRLSLEHPGIRIAIEPDEADALAPIADDSLTDEDLAAAAPPTDDELDAVAEQFPGA